MAKEDERFLQRLMATFKVEADEHVKAMSSLLLALENPESPEQAATLLETLFREAHSLKGAARAVNLTDIEAVCQALESVLAALKQQQIAMSAALFDVIYRSVDTLNFLLAPGDGVQTAARLAALLQELQHALQQAHSAAAASASASALVPAPVPASASVPASIPASMPVKGAAVSRAADPSGDETVRISTAKLGALLLQAEEFLIFKFSTEHLTDGLLALHNELVAWKKNWSKIVNNARAFKRLAEKNDHGIQQINGSHAGGNSRGKIPHLERLLEAIERDEFFAKSLSDRFAQLKRSAELERRALAGMVDNLLEDMKQTLMLPFAWLLEIFPKLVRDLARDSGKEVELSIDGAAIEIDRRILEQMKDPLIHLIRNAIDHGIETPEERKRQHKPAQGHLSIEIVPREGNKIELLVSDDGCGIDSNQVKNAAQELGLITRETCNAMSEQEAFALIFESGLSTSPILTDVSGRGLGLAIVREKVEKLDGKVTVESLKAEGTRFRIVLPASLATFRGLLIETSGRQFVLPSRNVERVARVPIDKVKTVENRETIELEGQVIGLVRLHAALLLPAPAPFPTSSTSASANGISWVLIVLLNSGGRRVAFAVDDVLADQEVLVKSLGPQLARVPHVAGATVLGAGRVVPILNVTDLLKTAQKADIAPVLTSIMGDEQCKSLLIAEDSITSRALLKSILETAGYNVTAAADGLEALTILRNTHIDLVVSDVEMPRMDGFGLTAKIRADPQLAALPVILVTALESRADKERGIDAGANAYIVKGSFDRNNLLDVIRRLL